MTGAVLISTFYVRVQDSLNIYKSTNSLDTQYFKRET